MGLRETLNKIVFEQDETPKKPQQDSTTPFQSQIAKPSPTSQPPSYTPPPTVFTQPATFSGGTDSNEVEEIKQKILAYVEKINKPGIDFLELYDALHSIENGITPQNIKFTFNNFFIASGKTLTKEYIIETANFYISEIQKLLEGDIQKKVQEKNTILNSMSNEKLSLEDAVKTLTSEIELKTKQLNEAKSRLAVIEGNYKPQLDTVDKKIRVGQLGLSAVVSDMQSILQLFTQTIQ